MRRIWFADGISWSYVPSARRTSFENQWFLWWWVESLRCGSPTILSSSNILAGALIDVGFSLNNMHGARFPFLAALCFNNDGASDLQDMCMQLTTGCSKQLFPLPSWIEERCLFPLRQPWLNGCQWRRRDWCVELCFSFRITSVRRQTLSLYRTNKRTCPAFSLQFCNFEPTGVAE